MKYSELQKRLKSFACVEIKRHKQTGKTKGSHRLWQNLDNEKCGEIPYHGSDEIRPGTLRQIIKKLGIDWSDFNNYN